jgi:hypothetical protein
VVAGVVGVATAAATAGVETTAAGVVDVSLLMKNDKKCCKTDI